MLTSLVRAWGIHQCYRLRNRGIETLPSIKTQDAADWKTNEPVASFSSVGSASFSSVADSSLRNDVLGGMPLTASHVLHRPF